MKTADVLTLETQKKFTITDTTVTTIVPAVTGRIAVITMISISSNTAQLITLLSTGEELPAWYVPADGPGTISTNDGVVCFSASGVAITATCASASHSTVIYVRYYYR